MNRRTFVPAAGLACAGLGRAGRAAAQSTDLPACAYLRPADVVYEPTPRAVVEVLLDLARVGPGDVVYDLGCGDGRIVVAAARRGAGGVGIEIDPRLVEWARANVRAEGLDAGVRIDNQDLFASDLSGASVVALYILPEMNRRLRPKLWRELAPGARVVANGFGVPGWTPERVVEVPTRYRHAYLYTVQPEHKAAA
ncbi:MAG: class I SAM-dependent methyltransferase [Burkholderiales bacterium]|nr:class I SAM-dependent methyltransferase [Burkholderiales bacterium]